MHHFTMFIDKYKCLSLYSMLFLYIISAIFAAAGSTRMWVFIFAIKKPQNSF